MDDIMKKIDYNNVINKRLAELESDYDVEKEKIEMQKLKIQQEKESRDRQL